MASRRRAVHTHADMFVTEVEAITLREFNEQQNELLIRTRTGTLAIRLIARRGRVPRLIDMRASDRKRRKEKFVAGVKVKPFIECKEVA